MKKNEIELLLNKLPGMLYRCKYDDDWTMEFLSDGCEELTGYLKEDMLFNKNISYASLIDKQDNDRIFKIVTKALDSKLPFSYEYRITDKNGQLKWVWEQGLGIYSQEGEVLSIEGFITDITSQKKQSDKLKQELNQKDKELMINLSLLNEYKKAVDASAIVTKTNVKGAITYVNDEFCRVSGFSKEEVLGKSHSIVRHPQNSESFFENLWKRILSKKIWKGVIKNRSKEGKTYYVQTFIVPILDYEGNIKEFMAIRHEVTDLVLQEKRIKFQTTDHLTQLPNRQKLLEDLQEDREFKLAILNIEKFKEINECYGFDTGDRLLVEVSVILSKALASYQTRLYKLAGDEFAVLADTLTNHDLFKKLVLGLLNTIKTYNFEIEEHHFNINILSGASMQKNYYINAEMATNYAKQTNSEFVFFDDNIVIKEQLENNINWTKKVKEAIADDRVVVFAQPIVSNVSTDRKKFECLVRIIDTDGEVISPVHFLNVAKKSRLYPEITKIVINKSVEYFKDKDVNFSINLTLEDILNPDVVKHLISKIDKYEGLGNKLVLEIVEDEGIENYDEVSTFIEKMKFYGCKIAIDDFGTGYSNFDYLMRLNVDFIKIDGSIIKNIAHDNNAKVVTELIVDFAKMLNIKTIGEFVFNKEVHDTVKSMGIDYSQGYLLGKPEPI